MTFGNVKSVLFVCLGNICRSPAAEAVMRALAPDLRIDSAGTGGWHVGAPPHPPMIAVAARRGYDLSGLRARQVTAADLTGFDRIIAMDWDNLRNLRRLAPEAAGPRLSLLLDHADGIATRDVPDPYFTGDYAGALDLIETGCRGLLRQLTAAGGHRPDHSWS